MGKRGQSISIVVEALGVTNTTIWKIQKKKETTETTIGRQTGWPRNTATVDDRSIVRAEGRGESITMQQFGDVNGSRIRRVMRGRILSVLYLNIYLYRLSSPIPLPTKKRCSKFLQKTVAEGTVLFVFCLCKYINMVSRPKTSPVYFSSSRDIFGCKRSP